jgi:DnaK suppressor protein
LSDIFPTGYHPTELASVEPGESVVIYGAGPVELTAAYSAMLRGAGKEPADGGPTDMSDHDRTTGTKGRGTGGARLTDTFLARQRGRLEKLRAELTSAGTTAEEHGREENSDEPRDFGDEGEMLTRRELEDSLHLLAERRLQDVERALGKIAEGTYGLSDKSGAVIPRTRLDKVPEAIYTIEEEAEREKKSGR